ncbi:MDR family MFS transporter [Citreimonas sp.]|uniref:MDR family MFS transporter n=1 Tax=Citreimonas sp. TaxID=3036715 RepID=UPI0040594E39
MTSTARTGNSPDLPDGAPDPVRVRIVLAAVAMTLLTASLGQTIVSTALPRIVSDLGGMAHITWVMTAYLLASTVGAPICGKLGDLFGRKIVMQGGIVVFLLGAVIAGLAQNMGVLIAGRAVQGLGGGGLIVVAMAVVADVLPPRERGKAQGILGAVFGVSTVLGPLIGGFLVEQLSWHWIFFANLPVGLTAFVALALTLKRQAPRARARVDYAGAALLAIFLSDAVLLSGARGVSLPGGDAVLVGGVVLALCALAGFIAVERRAAEPILPLALFRNPTFLVVNAVGFLVGMAMFGTITFMPLFLQVVKDVDATTSGLFLLPMMGGLLGTSILAGQVMSRTGRYRLLPVLSTGVLALAMLLLARIGAQSSLWGIAVCMLLVGVGLGPVFSIGVAAIQNAVPVSMLGIGTASANMFRLIGGSVGTAAFGALFSSGLATHLAGRLPEGMKGGVGSVSAEAVHALPTRAQAAVLDAFSQALHPIFLVAAACAVVSCLIATRLQERPLSATL